MKNLILLLTIVLSSGSFAQIRIEHPEKTEQIGKIMAGLISLDKTGDIYRICYDDAKFTKIRAFKCFSFQETGNDLDNLYSIISKGFEAGKKDDIHLDLPDDKVVLNFEKHFGIVSMRFSQLDKSTGIFGFSGYMTKKQVDRLFGKIK